MEDLVSLAQLKNFLSIHPDKTEEDGRLSNIITQVSTMVSSYCGRTFTANNYVEYYDGGTSSIFVDNPPILRINEVAQYDGTSYKILGCPGTSGQPIVVEGTEHAVELEGSPQLKTRVKQFNRSSVRFDGSSYLTIGDSEDWDFGVDDFTIELFARFDDVTANTQTLVSSGSAGNCWSFAIDFDSFGAVFTSNVSNIETISVSQGSTTGYSANQFYHLALEKSGTSLTLYRDGNTLATISTSNSVPQFDEGLFIAAQYDETNYLTGYMDDLRISHVARYREDFTAPNYPTAIDEHVKLLLRFDGSNNSTSIRDYSRTVNEFMYVPDTGEIDFNIGEGGGNQALSLFNPERSYNFSRGVRVNYYGGYETIPNDLELAVCEMSKIIYKGSSGTQSARFDGESRESHKLGIDDFPPQVRRVLNLYKVLS